MAHILLLLSVISIPTTSFHLTLSTSHDKTLIVHLHNQHSSPLDSIMVVAYTSHGSDTSITDSTGTASFLFTGVSASESPRPNSLSLSPYSISTKGISFLLSIPKASSYTFKLFDVSGRTVIRKNFHLTPGTYTLTIHISGVGFVEISDGENKVTGRFVSPLKTGPITLNITESHTAIRGYATPSFPVTLSFHPLWGHFLPHEDTTINLVPDTVEVNITLGQYWSDTISLVFPDSEPLPPGIQVSINDSTYGTDSTGSVAFRNFGLDSLFRVHVVVSDTAGSADTTFQADCDGRFFVMVIPETLTRHIYLSFFNQYGVPMDSILVNDSLYSNNGTVVIPVNVVYGDTTNLELFISGNGRHFDGLPMDTVIEVPWDRDVSDTLNLNQYWNNLLNFRHPDNSPIVNHVFLINNDSLTTDSTGRIDFRNYGDNNGFNLHVSDNSGIYELDTLVNNINSDTSFSFIVPQRIVFNLQDVSFNEDSSVVINNAINSTLGVDSVNISSMNNLVNGYYDNGNIVINGNPDANGNDVVYVDVYGSDGSFKRDSLNVNIVPMKDVWFKVVNSDFSELNDFDSVRVMIMDNGNNVLLDSVFSPYDSVHFQFPVNDTFKLYAGAYQSDSLGSFVTRYNFSVNDNNDVNKAILTSVYPYENFTKYNGEIAPRDSVLMFLEVSNTMWWVGEGPWFDATVDFEHVNDSLPPDSIVPPQHPHGMKTVIFREVDESAREAYRPDLASLTPEQVDSIIFWINQSFPGVLEQFKPEIIVVDVDSGNIWNYIRREGTAKRPKPGYIIIYGSTAANAYNGRGDWNFDHGGYVYRGRVSVDNINVFSGATLEEFLTVVMYPTEMNLYPEFWEYSVSVGDLNFLTGIDYEVLKMAVHLRYPWDNIVFEGPVVLAQDSVYVNNEYSPYLTISAGTYFNGNTHDNGFLRYGFPVR